MVPIEDLKRELREKVPPGIDIALQALKLVIPPDVPKYTDVILLESRYRDLHKSMLDNLIDEDKAQKELALLRKDILAFINALEQKDFVEQSAAQVADAKAKKGKILYRIPDKMKVQQEVKCLIRIAFYENILMSDLQKEADDTIKEVRIADRMGVELIDPNEQKTFAIRTFSEKVQTIDEEAFSEWLFYVKPLLEGMYPLLLKVSVVEIGADGKERKREVVLEEMVQVVAIDVPEDEKDFTDTGYEVQTVGKSGGESGKPIARKKKGTTAAAAVLTAVVLAFIAIWIFQPQFMPDDLGPGNGDLVTGPNPTQEDLDSIRNDSNALINFQLAYKDSDPALAAQAAYQLESLRFTVDAIIEGDSVRFEATHGNYPMQLAYLDADGNVLANTTVESETELEAVTLHGSRANSGSINIQGNARQVVITDANGEKRIVVLPEVIAAVDKGDNIVNPNGSDNQKSGTGGNSSTKKNNTKDTDTKKTNGGSGTAGKTNAGKNTKTTVNQPKRMYTIDNVPRQPILNTSSCYNKKRLDRSASDSSEFKKELKRAFKCTQDNIPRIVERELQNKFGSRSFEEQAGTVYFVVKKDGSIAVQSVDTKFNKDFQTEIKTAVENLPGFIPAQDENGKPTEVLYYLRIRFKL